MIATPKAPFLFILCASLFLWGCGSNPAPNKDSKLHRALSLNWFAEAEHGGYFQILVHEKQEPSLSFVLDIQPGGPNSPVVQKVATGQCDFGVANADDVVLAQAQGADVVAVFSPLDSNPRCIMVREDSGINHIKEISNMTLAMSSRPSFSHWLRSKFDFNNVKIVPYPGSIAPFVHQKNFAQQAYNISEPFLAEQHGVKARVLMVSDLGYNPYGSVLITRREFLKQHPDVVKEMVLASRKAWQAYLGNPSQANALINIQNPEMGLDILTYGHQKMQDLITPNPEGFGRMELERWELLVDQMTRCGLIEKGIVTPNQCYDLSFLP